MTLSEIGYWLIGGSIGLALSTAGLFMSEERKQHLANYKIAKSLNNKPSLAELDAFINYIIGHICIFLFSAGIALTTFGLFNKN